MIKNQKSPLSDDAWKEVLADIEDLNKYCIDQNGEINGKFDLADYVFVNKDDYDYEKLLLHFGGIYARAFVFLLLFTCPSFDSPNG